MNIRIIKKKLRRLGRRITTLAKRCWAYCKEFFRKAADVFLSLRKPVQIALGIGIPCVLAAVIILCAAAGPKRSEEGITPNDPNSADASKTGVGAEGTAIVEITTGLDSYGVEITVTPAPDEPAAPTYTPHPLGGKVYEHGDSDEFVITLQSRLMDLGYMDGDEPTNYFGSYTESCLKAFQRHNGMTEDGVLGATTYDLLFGDDARVYVMQRGDEGDDVVDAQARLYELGYLEKGSITGTFGELTEAAVLNFQAANKLTADGKVGAKTLAKLYDEDVVGNFYGRGDKNDTILKYQQRLVNLGYLDSGTTVDGELDSEMVSAIKKFQDANGLVKDGCLGPATMDALDSSDALAYALRLGMSGSDVKTMQKRLYKLGYLSSSQVTGYFGETTQAAVIKFQKRNGLTADGAVGSKTLVKLNSDSAKAAATASSTDDKTSSTGSTATATPKPSTTTGVERFIEIAKSKLGCPYVRGAKGPNSFDCSGFVYWCLNQAGVKQSYMTSTAWRSCTKYKKITSMSDLKRGDVLVFTGDGSGKGHVGIYLGSNKMIDASSSNGKVVERSSISTNYWKTHFYCAFRIWD